MKDINEVIKDLYKYISFSKKSENFSHDTDWKWNKELGEEIEHLIKAYKELEEERDNYQGCFIVTKENSIPVSLVEEKIEELNNSIDLAIDNSKGGLDEEFIEKGSKLLAQKKVLQELLEERKVENEN